MKNIELVESGDRSVLTLSETEHERFIVNRSSDSDVTHFAMESDLCGDSETGFGANIELDLTIEQVKALHQFLGTFLP